MSGVIATFLRPVKYLIDTLSGAEDMQTVQRRYQEQAEKTINEIKSISEKDRMKLQSDFDNMREQSQKLNDLYADALEELKKMNDELLKAQDYGNTTADEAATFIANASNARAKLNAANHQINSLNNQLEIYKKMVSEDEDEYEDEDIDTFEAPRRWTTATGGKAKKTTGTKKPAPAKKPAAKKPVPAKPAAKKPAAKKPVPAKKPAAKK